MTDIPDAPETGGEAGETPVLGIADTITHMTAVVAAAGPDHIDPAAVALAEPIHHQLTNPDAATARTRYTHADQPSCLVGHVLAAAGVTLEELTHLDSQKCSRLDAVTVTGVTISPWALWLLTAAQHDQDDATTWGEILEWTIARADDHQLLDDLDPDLVDTLRAAADDAIDGISPDDDEPADQPSADDEAAGPS